MSSAGPGFVKRGGGHGYDARGELIGQNAAALNYVGKGLGELFRYLDSGEIATSTAIDRLMRVFGPVLEAVRGAV